MALHVDKSLDLNFTGGSVSLSVEGNHSKPMKFTSMVIGAGEDNRGAGVSTGASRSTGFGIA